VGKGWNGLFEPSLHVRFGSRAEEGWRVVTARCWRLGQHASKKNENKKALKMQSS